MAAASRAMLLRRHGPVVDAPLELIERPVPEPGPGEVLVRVRACAVCRTDLHVIEEELPSAGLPRVPGHQVVGVVERRGEGCSRIEVGERVGVAWLRHTCGGCTWCRSGSENLCPDSRYTGYHADGGYADHVVVDERFAYRIPAVFGDVEATPLLCAGIIGYRALTRSRVPEGGSLGLFGFGSSAHVVLQIAKHRGCRVFVATRGEGHQELARSMGADWIGETVDPFPEPVDGAIVFAPAGEIVPVALRGIRPGGTVTLAGIYMTPTPEMDYDPHLFHEKTLTSVEANTRADGEALLREAAGIPIRPETTVFRLERANEALQRLKSDRINGTAVLRV